MKESVAGGAPRRKSRSRTAFRARPDSHDPRRDRRWIERIRLLASIASREDYRDTGIVHYPGRKVDRIVGIEYAAYSETAIDHANVLSRAMRQDVVHTGKHEEQACI